VNDPDRDQVAETIELGKIPDSAITVTKGWVKTVKNVGGNRIWMEVVSDRTVWRIFLDPRSKNVRRMGKIVTWKDMRKYDSIRIGHVANADGSRQAAFIDLGKVPEGYLTPASESPSKAPSADPPKPAK
jgi:hypothetical protein